jgi:glutamate N-acetyltransferase/amino-acid N-acetyltransferase
MAQALHLLSPKGFRAAGVYAGIKSKNAPDVGLLICDRLAAATALFTTNPVFAAPIKVGRQHIRAGKLRGVVVNAGNANACTGKQGERDALRMCAIAASVAGCKPAEILPSSTGIIGHLLPMEKLERGIAEAGQNLGSSAEHATLFSDAILTTDTKRKTAAIQIKIGRERVTIAGVCKGSGMIGPRMALSTWSANSVNASKSPGSHSPGLSSASRRAPRATGASGARGASRASRIPAHATMLAYLTTDANLPSSGLDKMMASATDVSFNAVTVDDHTSTNDTAVLLASGLGPTIRSARDLSAFSAALNEVCESLARQIAADGEGATKVVTITVRRCKSAAVARAVARAVANSPLVKCAMNGNDPNWGRIVSAAGLAGVPFDPDRCTLTLQGTKVFRAGRPLSFDAAAVSRKLAANEVLVDLDCAAGATEATVWTCDLSKEYVAINADYHT